VAVKHTLAAGVAALALLIAPVGLTVQWNDHGPAISTTLAISTVHAASNGSTPKKPPASGGPTFTSSGTASRTEGFASPGGKWSNEMCQEAAELFDFFNDELAEANATGDSRVSLWMAQEAQTIENAATSNGCVFIY
jgi:hypothetical protein